MLSRVVPDNAPPWLRSTSLNNLDIDFQLLRNRLLRSYSSIARANVALSDDSFGRCSGNKISNLTFYDLKSAWTQAKNYALNISDIEAKVNEATSDDPWGASSTLMQEIAGATQNFQDFNEIMPAIFRNFMEREAREWRQIYKSLTLLEYLTKHGSERVVDDARAHLGTIKILRNFHYIDEAGKDQGLNVRNRAKELSELLSDVDRIRQERRKARANRQKYQGVSNSDFVPGSGGGRYGGFGSDSFNAGGGAVGTSSGAGAYPGGAAARESFDEYDAGDDDVAGSAPRRSTASRSSASVQSSSRGAAAPPKKKAPEAKVADLFSFDDDEPAAAPAAPQTADAFGDDFDDFQGAPSAAPAKQAASRAAPPPAPKASGGDIFDFLGGDNGSSSSAPTSSVTSPSARPSTSSVLSPSSLRPTMQTASSSASLPAAQATLPSQQGARPSTSSKPATSSGLSGFDDLWASSAGSSKRSAAGNGKKTMADLAKEKTGAGVWGGGASSGGAQQQQQQKKDVFDFL
ncbi:ENTH-domain-containing protein [Microstroma glucosiphilum]|uniref:ENTH-domain-containing protein n=1 Tax=Pseudomicrostroma glucosiphilum TaxID=1684307 RepID=A0A316UKB2_9BASI|nr:ENTH-domain-containing protein [Pseudomicrostroma glucosiphilum]PWN23665.1 ENTH-domain-containing protein [Pseudomicrostroma glucosiphilum]